MDFTNIDIKSFSYHQQRSNECHIIQEHITLLASEPSLRSTIRTIVTFIVLTIFFTIFLI